MFSAKSYQVSRPGLKKPKPKKKKLASGGGPLSARSGSTGSLPAYPTPRRVSSRQRSLTAEQPRLRRAQMDSRVREAAAPSRQGRRLAPLTTQQSRQLQLGDRLPSLRARIAEMKALASFFPDSELSVSDATGSETRAHVAALLKLRDHEQRAARTRRKPFKPAGSLRSRRPEPPGPGRRPAVGSGQARPAQSASPRRRGTRSATGSTASSSEHRDRPAPGSGDRRRAEDCSDQQDGGLRLDYRDTQTGRGQDRGRQEHHSSEGGRQEYHGDGRGPPDYHSEERRERSAAGSPERGVSSPAAAGSGGAAARGGEESGTGPVPPPSGPQADAQETASDPPGDPLKLLAPLQIPNLHNLVAGSGGGGPKNLQDVIKDFLWAKQQASATANVMSNLRSLMEAGTGQVGPEERGPAEVPAGEPSAPAQPDTASSAASLASSAGTTYLLPGQSQPQLPAGRRHPQDGSEAGSVKRSVSEDGLQFVHSGALQSVQSGGLQSIQSVGLQSVHSEGLPSTQSGAIQSSGSGAPQSAQSGLQSGQAASQEPADVTQLRTQFQLQRDKLKHMEQKNYVLSLAVEGQEKTIRTITAELQEAREGRRSAPDPGQQATLSAQSWPMVSSKTEIAAEDANRRELDRLNVVLESKEQELNILKAYRPAKEVISFSVGKPRISQAISSSHQLDQAGPCEGWRQRLDGARTRSTELYQPSAEATITKTGHYDLGSLRRHSFTVPPSRDDAWLGAAGLCQSRLGVAPVSCQSTPIKAGRPLPCMAPEEPLMTHFTHDSGPAGCAGRQDGLRQAVQESLSRVRQLETELAELRARRDRGGHGAESGLPPDPAGPGEPTAGRLCNPFPQIVRMTEVKLQQTYQSLSAEQSKNRLLNKALLETTARLDQQTSQSERLKERLASSVEERRQLQTRLSAAETASTAANNKQQQLSEDLQRKTQLLAQTSQDLNERMHQVAVLSRQLEGTRAEAAHETGLAAERLSQLRARAAELEKLIDRQEAENRLLRQASAETDQLTQAGRRLRQRVLELTDKLERSTATGKMLENYVLFLKTSYSRMFGSAVPAPGPGLEAPASLRDLLHSAETQ